MKGIKLSKKLENRTCEIAILWNLNGENNDKHNSIIVINCYIIIIIHNL